MSNLKNISSPNILLFLSSLFILNPCFLVINHYNIGNLPPFNPNLDIQIQEIMTQIYIPSVATAVVRDNSIIWAKGYGEQSDLDTIYMIGSVTKTFTATAIFQIYEQGLIQLSDDVNKYLPFSLRSPNYTDTPITIQMLLTHKSGLAKDNELYIYGVAEDALLRLGIENPNDWLPYPHWIKEHLTQNGSLYIPEAWTSFKPGSTLHYSNIGYNVLGYILELVTGKPIWEYVQENILEPLEMHNTGYNFTEFDESQLAKPYIYKFELDPESTGNKAYPHYNYLGYSSGAMRTNVFDLARFLLVHLHKGISFGTRILAEETIQLMHQIQASWLDGKAGLVDWSGWGGTEGDVYGFHAKGYGIHDGSTTASYAIITFLNQGIDQGRDAAFTITSLLQDYVHRYDSNLSKNLDSLIVLILIFSLPILIGLSLTIRMILIKKKTTSQNRI